MVAAVANVAVTELLAQARQARQQGQHEQALALFEQLCARQPLNHGARWDRVGVLCSLGRLEEAQELVSEHLHQHPQDASAWVMQGQVNHAQGALAQAVAALRRACELHPGHAQAPLTLARWLVQTGELAQAEAVLAEFVTRHPNHPAAWRQRIELALRQGQAEQAIAWLQTLVQHVPGELELVTRLANLLREHQRLDEAAHWLSQPLPEAPSAAGLDAWWHARGLLAIAQGQPEQGETHWRNGLSATPGATRCAEALVWHLLPQGRLEEAEQVLHPLLQPEQGATLSLRMLGVHLLRAQGQLDDALHQAQALCEQHPQHFACWHLLAELSLALAQFDTTAHAITRMSALENGGENERYFVVFMQASLARARYQLDEALTHTEALVALPQKRFWAFEHLLIAWMLHRGCASARPALQHQHRLRCQAAPPGQRPRRADRPEGFAWMIWQELNQNQYAEQALQQALALAPAQRCAALAQAFDQEPGHLGLAVAQLLALRSAGAWPTPPNGPAQPAPHPNVRAMARWVIPARIGQFWDSTKRPDDIEAGLRTWPQVCQGFEHQVFDDLSAAAFVARHCAPEVLQALHMAQHPAMRADVFRLAWLWVRGGVYADADDHCRHTLAGCWPTGSTLWLLQEDIGTLGNNFMAAAPGHPFIGAALAQVVRNVLQRQGDDVWFTTGPGAITPVFCQHYASDLAAGRCPPGVHLVDIFHLQRYVSMHLSRRYKQGQQHWLNAAQPATPQPLFRKPMAIRPKGGRALAQ